MSCCRNANLHFQIIISLQSTSSSLSVHVAIQLSIITTSFYHLREIFFRYCKNRFGLSSSAIGLVFTVDVDFEVVKLLFVRDHFTE